MWRGRDDDDGDDTTDAFVKSLPTSSTPAGPVSPVVSRTVVGVEAGTLTPPRYPVPYHKARNLPRVEQPSRPTPDQPCHRQRGHTARGCHGLLDVCHARLSSGSSLRRAAVGIRLQIWGAGPRVLSRPARTPTASIRRRAEPLQQSCRPYLECNLAAAIAGRRAALDRVGILGRPVSVYGGRRVTR